MLVVVEHHQVGVLRGRRDDQIGNRNPVLSAAR
jgi:hypothetical protein